MRYVNGCCVWHHPAAGFVFSRLTEPLVYIYLVLCAAGAWSFSVSELAAPGVEVGRLTATDADLGENALLEFNILDSEEADIFNLTRRDKEAVIVLNKVGDETREHSVFKTDKLSQLRIQLRVICPYMAT